MDNLDNFRERVEVLEQQTAQLQQHTHTVERRFRWWRGIACGVVILLGAIGIALGSVTPAHADVIQCGDVLGPGGRFELEHDLVCDGTRPVVTVQDGAILDFNGHIVSCTPGRRCIVLTGAGTQLLNGAVFGQFETIILEGKGGHTVRNVTSGSQAFAIVVKSDNNQLINVFGESEGNPAFSIRGSHNRLTGSIAHCLDLVDERGCIQVDGNENLLIDNFATSTTSLVEYRNSGFWITGNNNVLSTTHHGKVSKFA